MAGTSERVEEMDQVCSEEESEGAEELDQVCSEEEPNDHVCRVAVVSCISQSRPVTCPGLGERSQILDSVMKALDDPKIHLIGVYGSDDKIKRTLLGRVERRIQLDNLFDLVLTTTVTGGSDVKRIQGIQKEIADKLDLTFNLKSEDGRAQELIKRIKIEPKILIVLHDLQKKLDLGKVGIPYGSDHKGCKIILTSTTEDVLSNHMHTDTNFSIV